MANEINKPHPNFITTKTANAAISKGKALKILTSDTSKFDIAGAGEAALFVALEDAASGAPCTAVSVGFVKALVDGSGTAIAAGDWLIPNGTNLVKATGNVPAIGVACDASTAAGDLISILIVPSRVGTA